MSSRPLPTRWRASTRWYPATSTTCPNRPSSWSAAPRTPSARPLSCRRRRRSVALQVELVSPEEVVLRTSASMVLVRTSDGDIAFQPGHVPFVGVLLPERVRIYSDDGDSQLIAVHSGFVEVAGDKVAILSDVAELAGDIDAERAAAAAERARAALAADPDDAEAAAALKRAEIRLSVAAGTAI
ncbi:MAG: ATP synthase F1 subunit epsilon [Acidimicrobiia bacterium]|nr:ATP synthase F1 subunit epsilon [Acidimicrobiia bacterium]